MEDLISIFLSVSYGDGYGYGDGSGDSNCNGYSYDYGDGSDYGYWFTNGYGYGSDYGHITAEGKCYGCGGGSGDGNEYGNGFGSVNGSSIIEYNNNRVYYIDYIPTLIDSVHGNYAKGRIVNSDLTTEECYIAKYGDFFAHGSTLAKALQDATNKYNQNLPIEERISNFVKEYPSLDSKAKHKDLYLWHHILTGSCEFGRDEFARENNLDKDNGFMTIAKFINLTRNEYGGYIIQQLEKAYK